MARGINKVTLIGNLGNDPDVRYTPAGKCVVGLSIATSESWKDRNTGESKEKTEWHRVVIYDKTAEFAAQYLKKGSKVYIEGKLQTRKWQDQGGVDHWTTEVIVDIRGQLQSLDPAPTNGQGSNVTQMRPQNNQQPQQNRQPQQPHQQAQQQVAGSDVQSQPPQGAPGGAGGHADIYDDDIPFEGVHRRLTWI